MLSIKKPLALFSVATLSVCLLESAALQPAASSVAEVAPSHVCPFLLEAAAVKRDHLSDRRAAARVDLHDKKLLLFERVLGAQARGYG